MTKEITEGNKLIAEFMGLTSNPYDNGKTWANGTKIIDGDLYADSWTLLFYHSSWDWLMPVVEEIRDMHDLHNLQNTIIYLIHKQGGMDARLNSISGLWMAVVEFIKSDNQNLKSKN
jgi:hypothetical protein